MKRTTKFVIGTAAMVAVSAGVAGVTAYTLIQKNQQQNANSFYDVFKGAPMRTVALDATSMQPVDLTQAAESSLNSVVAQSMNLYITNNYSMRQVLRLYLEAWRAGVKTIYKDAHRYEQQCH